MNLYFRALIVLIKVLFGGKRSWQEPSVLSFRVYPFDCDVNFHLTSARYVGLADLGRIHLLGQMGIFNKLLRNRYLPLANGIEITYIRPIKPFEKFQVRSKIATWDEKYWYAEHNFEAGGQLRAIAIVRGVFVQNRTIVPLHEIVSLAGADPAAPPPSRLMEQWKMLLEVKKEEYASVDRNSSKHARTTGRI